MNTLKKITQLEDIKQLVDTFYRRVREDELLGPVFEEKIQENWPRHLDIMYRFWQTLLLEEHTYYGSPFIKHIPLPIDAQHFARWLDLFHQTVDELFAGEKAEEAKWRASRMAEMFEYKLNYLRRNSTKPLM